MTNDKVLTAPLGGTVQLGKVLAGRGAEGLASRVDMGQGDVRVHDKHGRPTVADCA